MSQVIICIYDNSNTLVDSVSLNRDEAVSNDAIIAMIEGDKSIPVRVNILKNIFSVHIDADAVSTVEFAEQLKLELNGENVEGVIRVWCDLTGSVPANARITRVGAHGFSVNLNTLGGWSTFTLADKRNQTEMADLKQWILEKAGLMADQRRDGTRAIHATHVSTAGLNFLGYVTSESEILNGWPAAALQPGSAWLDSLHLYVCNNITREGRTTRTLLKYLRSEVGAPERAKSLIADQPDMPVKAKPATRWLDLATWRAHVAEQRIEAGLLDFQLDALLHKDPNDPRNDGILAHNAGVQIEVDPTRAGGFIVWAGGEGYPVTGHGGLETAQLLELDARFNNQLSLNLVPTELFQCFYSFSGEHAIKYAREHLQHRVMLAVTPDHLIFVDSIDVLTISREYGLPEEVYHMLMARYPMLAGSIAVTMFSKLYPVLRDYSISTTGPMQEALSFRNTVDDSVVSFLLSDWPSITDWASSVTAADAAIERETATEWAAAQDQHAQDELARARELAEGTTAKVTDALEGLRSRRGERLELDVSQTADPAAAVEVIMQYARGQTPGLLHVDESPLREEPKFAGTLGLKDPNQSNERGISVAVVDGNGKALHMVHFIFSNPLAYESAIDVGFTAQVAAALGQTGFKGSFIGCPRIAQVGMIAEDLFKSMGLAGDFRYERS